jgi:hypothetical protein
MGPKLAFRLLMFLLPVVVFAKYSHGHFINGMVDTPEEREYIQRTVYFNPDFRPLSNKFYDAPGGIFRIHWLEWDPTRTDSTFLMAHRPQSVDLNNNGVPDYVDTVATFANFVYDIYINHMGYKSPFPEPEISDQYDIYLWDLGDSDDNQSSIQYDPGGLYGFTLPFGNINDGIPSSQAKYSYLVIDNDFSATDSVRFQNGSSFPAYRETGSRGLLITLAHEFHHSIQAVYDTQFLGNSLLAEMTSTAMEKRILDDSEDYFQYVEDMFDDLYDYPFSDDSPTVGYAYSIFGQFLMERFSIEPEEPNDEILLNTWSKINLNGYNAYEALDVTLQEENTDLAETFCEFADWLYHTGSRAYKKPEGEKFSNAAEIPEFQFSNFEFYSNPSAMGSGELSPFEISSHRIVFPKPNDNETRDTLDLVFVNNDTQDLIENTDSPSFFTYDVNSASGEDFLEEINYYLNLNENSGDMCTHIYQHSGTKVFKIDFAYPNPFKLGQDNTLYFPAPGVNNNSRATLSIYTNNMSVIFSSQLDIEFDANLNAVVVLEEIPELSSGVYVFTVDTSEDRKIGKFTVIRN